MDQLADKVTIPISTLLNNFFGKPNSHTVGRFRIALGVMTLIHFVLLTPFLRMFFSDDGIVPLRGGESVTDYLQNIFLFNDSHLFVVIVWGIAVSASIALALGFYSNIASLISYYLMISFLNRDYAVGYGGFSFLSFALLFSSLLPLDEKFSFTRHPLSRSIPNWVQGWGSRMIQLEICTVYLISAIHKMSNPGWVNGTQLLGTLNLYGAYWNFSWLQHTPILVAAFTYGTIFIELLFPFLIWFKRTRNVAIISVFGLHVGILLTMNVTFLGEVMMSLVLIFWDRDRSKVNS